MPGMWDLDEVPSGLRIDDLNAPRRTPATVYRQYTSALDVFRSMENEFEFTQEAHHITHVMDTWSGVVWVVPAAGAKRETWLQKAVAAAAAGATVVVLVEAQTGKAWWWDYALQAEIRLLRGNVQIYRSPTSAAVLIFGPKVQPGITHWDQCEVLASEGKAT